MQYIIPTNIYSKCNYILISYFVFYFLNFWNLSHELLKSIIFLLTLNIQITEIADAKSADMGVPPYIMIVLNFYGRLYNF